MLSIRTFIHQHDDIPAFHAAYFVLIMLSAALLNLGVFAVLIVIHMALDFVKYRDFHGCTLAETCEGIVRESLVDVTLLFIGLLFSVYLHHSVGIASLSGLMRTELSLLRSIALFLPKVKILHHVLKMIAHLHHYLEQVHPRHRNGWSDLDVVCFWFLGISLTLLIVSAPIMHVEWSVVLHILYHELFFI